MQKAPGAGARTAGTRQPQFYDQGYDAHFTAHTREFTGTGAPQHLPDLALYGPAVRPCWTVFGTVFGTACEAVGG